MASVRRLTAILTADAAGYSRLMGADEEGTHVRLSAHLQELVNPKIAEHRGRVVKNTGDGFLAEFASVLDAVRCSVEVQGGMADREPEVPEEQRIGFSNWHKPRRRDRGRARSFRRWGQRRGAVGSARQARGLCDFLGGCPPQLRHRPFAGVQRDKRRLSLLSPRVYVSDIDIGRTVEATAGIWSDTRIRSPRRGPISPGCLMVVTTDPNPFRVVDDGWPDERCRHRCRPQ
jgi:hypothetical protein